MVDEMTTSKDKPPILVIDANQYLDLYGIKDGRDKLLQSLEDHRTNIFITSQIVEEVDRNKVRVVHEYLQNRIKQFHNQTGEFPFYLLDIPHNQLEKLKAVLRTDGADYDIKRAIEETLRRVSRSEDSISRALKPIFEQAKIHSKEQLARARDRKERGSPPGKFKNALGDQITWEQLLDACRNTNDLSIITGDEDYFTNVDSTPHINALLYRELLEINPSLNVRCRTTLADGIMSFVSCLSLSGVQLTRLTPEEIRSIDKQQREIQQLNLIQNALQRALGLFSSLGLGDAGIVGFLESSALNVPMHLKKKSTSD